MKLPSFFDHAGLNGLRYEMGADKPGAFKAIPPGKVLTREELVELATNGIDVTSDKIEVLEDGTLSFKGLRVLVYIRDVSDYGHERQMPRFHFASCRTLEEMQRMRRFTRYVVATRDDGVFQVNIVRKGRTDSSLEQLSVCQNCLDRLSFRGFSYAMARNQRLDAVARFSLQDFFAEYPRDVLSQLPAFTSETQPLNDYTSDWPLISEGLKRERGMRCEKCFLEPGTAGFLHTHHRDGSKWNNDPSNLEVLCIGCHAAEHPHMKGQLALQEFLRLFPRDDIDL